MAVGMVPTIADGADHGAVDHGYGAALQFTFTGGVHSIGDAWFWRCLPRAELFASEATQHRILRPTKRLFLTSN